MARYEYHAPLHGVDVNFITQAISEYMISEGFSLIDHKGQQVWKKGSGLLTAPQYFAFGFTPNEVVLEAFLRTAILPGVYGKKEYGIDGAYAALPKKLLRDRVETVQLMLAQFVEQAQAAYAGQGTAPAQATPEQETAPTQED